MKKIISLEKLIKILYNQRVKIYSLFINMPKRLAVLILVTFIPVVQYITKFLKDYKRKNFKSDL